jgi:hypothetical protein
MAITLAQAASLSNNQLELGVVEEIIEKEDLFAVLPFMAVDGKAYVYNRENSQAQGDWLATNTTVNESSSTFTEITTNLRILIGDVDVDKFIDSTLSNNQSQKAVQIAQKAKGMGRQFKQTLVIGDHTATPNQFDGLVNLVTGGQTISAATNGAALTLGMLDQLLDAVPNGADVIFMNYPVMRAFRALLRAAGGNSAVEYMLPQFGRPMLTHNGVPVLLNSYIPINETQGTAVGITTSVYAARLNEADGLHAIYGGGTAGIVVEDIGTVQTKDATRTRLKWYVSLVLKSTKSLARLKGLTNIV